MDSEVFFVDPNNTICWWIPFKKTRNSVRNALKEIQNIKEYINDDKNIIKKKDFAYGSDSNLGFNAIIDTNMEYISEEDISFYNAYKKHKGNLSDKWEGYLYIYSKFLKPYILENKPINLLEIGIQNGGSLQLWEQYLPKGSTIVGVDIDPNCANLNLDNDNVKVYIGDATDKEFVCDNFSNSKFDIIIDDGSHICFDVISSFELLFEKLNYGGLYIIEDCHTSYWKNFNDYGGSFRGENTHIEYFKNLVDSINYYSIEAFPNNDEYLKARKYTEDIASISFYDSIIVIEKYYQAKKRPFKRMLAGEKNIIKELDESLKDCKVDNETNFVKFYKHD